MLKFLGAYWDSISDVGGGRLPPRQPLDIGIASWLDNLVCILCYLPLRHWFIQGSLKTRIGELTEVQIFSRIRKDLCDQKCHGFGLVLVFSVLLLQRRLYQNFLGRSHLKKTFKSTCLLLFQSPLNKGYSVGFSWGAFSKSRRKQYHLLMRVWVLFSTSIIWMAPISCFERCKFTIS